MGNNPSRAQHHHNLLHPHHGNNQAQSAPSQGPQGNNTGSSSNASPQRNSAINPVRRGSLPHTPLPTSTKPYQGLYPIRVGHGQATVQGIDHAFLDPRGLLSDLSGVRRGSTGGVDIGGSGGGGGGRSGDPFGGTVKEGIYNSGLPPQFQNPDPFKTQKINKQPSFITEEPPETTLGMGAATEGLQRRGSMRSTTTVEEDDVAIDESRTIPTLVTWPDGGEKVYITGTFCGWRKKYRLTRGPESNIFSAIVPLPAGTHHVKFLVDGELRTSDALPTAVDSTGILINYLEVNADDMLAPLERQPSPDRTEPSKNQEQPSSSSQEHPDSRASPNQQSQQPHQHDQHTHTHSTLSSDEQFAFIQPRPQRYTDVIPAYLRDFEENQDRYVVTGSAMQSQHDSGMLSEGAVKVPPPPTLPLMLGKVILNSSSHLKDDNSVLGIPNHVVLNHLATSSIKNHVLAVSATTRYKKKYVSTILYKATSG